SKAFNDASIFDYYFRIHNPAHTFVKGVHLLPSASCLSYGFTKGLKIDKYWVPGKIQKYHFANDDDWYACAKELIYQSIEKRIIADTQIGITLSGGLDSSSIACVLANILKEKNKPLYAFSSVLPVNHQGKDERHFIEHLVKLHPNIIPTYIEATDSGTFTNLKDNFYIDEAIPNAFHYVDHAILNAAKNKGVQNLFTGYGGDFWVSWKGTSVIYQLFAEGKYQQAMRLLTLSKQNGNHSALSTIKSNLLAHTQVYKALKSKLRKGKLKSFFNQDFIRPYRSLLNDSKASHKAQVIENVNSGSEEQKSLWETFIAGLIGGFLAFIMPCIFPMVPLTISYFTKRAGSREKGIGQALIYGLSIIVIY
ncbi:MAG: hypothetical protein EOO07_36715, partial [Chitinophagaceae bacterium]